MKNKTQRDDRMCEIDREFMRRHERVQEGDGSSFFYYKEKKNPVWNVLFWILVGITIFVVVTTRWV